MSVYKKVGNYLKTHKEKKNINMKIQICKKKKYFEVLKNLDFFLIYIQFL